MASRASVSVLRVSTGLPGKRRAWSITWLIGFFAVGLAAPLLVILTLDAVRDLGDRVHDVAEQVAKDVDLQLTGYIALLQTLATSRALQTNDISAAYDQALTA